jgi:hypothetical protein
MGVKAKTARRVALIAEKSWFQQEKAGSIRELTFINKNT